MAKTKGFTITKAYAAKLKAKDEKMTADQRRAVSKALVNSNSEANTPKKSRKV